MKNCVLLIVCLCCVYTLFSQKQEADSVLKLLAAAKADTTRVTLMWQVADFSYLYNPDSSLKMAQQALYLAQKIKYTEGESRSLGVLATACREVGDYKKALMYLLQKLQIEEKRTNHRSLASVLINIGILYVSLEQYDEALSYYRRANAIITENNVADLKYYISNNMGDVFERMKNDSALIFFTESLRLGDSLNNNIYRGASMVGIGHYYLGRKNYDLALQYYKQGIVYLELANNDDLICEATINLAKLYNDLKNDDSTEHYALKSFHTAERAGFQARELDAVEFLYNYYRQRENISKSFAFIEKAKLLKDSITGSEKIRELQIISTNEQLRQNEIAESKRKAEEERHQQLQMLMIGLFISVLFLITLVLSRVNIHSKTIRFLGIISLLMLFEYLTLWLHPWVVELTHHTPVFEILIFVGLAAILIPAHHNLEHWLIERLTRKKTYSVTDKIKISRKKIEIKKPSGEE